MISATILTKDNEKRIGEVLINLQWVDEIVILDTGSSDDTLIIASSFQNVTIHHGKLEGFGQAHNLASSLAKNDWILSIDSDEIVSLELANEIRALTLDPDAVYSISRHNYYNDKWIRCCSWYPDRVFRLYNRRKTRFSDDKVHEKVLTKEMKTSKLQHPLRHYSYENTADFLRKMQTYTDLFAEQNRGKKTSGAATAIFHTLVTFLRCYFLKKGFLFGFEGFFISVYNANCAFYKYVKLMERKECKIRLCPEEKERCSTSLSDAQK